MRTRAGAESVESRGATSWNDWFDPIDGRGDGNGGSTKAEDSGTGAGRARGDGESSVGKTAGFDALDISTQVPDYPGLSAMTECAGGICPVPWAVKEEAPTIQPDEVNHPPHYTDGGIECIEAIEASLTPEEFRGYCKGNLMKYGWRERLKGGTKSLKKAQWYLDRLIAFDEAQKG